MPCLNCINCEEELHLGALGLKAGAAQPVILVPCYEGGGTPVEVLCDETICSTYTETISGGDDFTIPAGSISWSITNLGNQECAFWPYTFEMNGNVNTVPAPIIVLGSETIMSPNKCSSFDEILVTANPGETDNTLFITYTLCELVEV